MPLSLKPNTAKNHKEVSVTGHTLKTLENLSFDNSYTRLPEVFFERRPPTPVKAPKLIKFNKKLAKNLGIDSSETRAIDHDILVGNRLPPQAEPIAMVYAGHQFGNWVPRLGDGRAVLLGEILDHSGNRWDIQLKGSGPTTYSRMGDGRAVLGPVMREFLVSEAMSNLGIRTTRALAMSLTGEMVMREQMEPGAILTRVASSHIRVGTFQYFYGQDDINSVRILADYAIKRHYPNAQNSEQPYLALLSGVVQNTAELIASWMLVGFIHGVMNTDNTSISGETIDYGPCAFMDGFDPNKTFSSIDREGRYAYNHQPTIGQWNLTRFAETLVKLIGKDQAKSIELAKQVLEGFWGHFETVLHKGLCKKIGLTLKDDDSKKLAFDFLDLMSEGEVDFTLAYRNLANMVDETDDTVKNLFGSSKAFDDWLGRWSYKLKNEGKDRQEVKAGMNSINPAFIPRNHQIEKAINLATQTEDFNLMENLLTVLENPFETNEQFHELSLPPTADEEVSQTFCGT